MYSTSRGVGAWNGIAGIHRTVYQALRKVIVESSPQVIVVCPAEGQIFSVCSELLTIQTVCMSVSAVRYSCVLYLIRRSIRNSILGVPVIANPLREDGHWLSREGFRLWRSWDPKKITEDEIAKSGPLNWFLFELFQHLHGLRTIQNYCRATLNNRVNNICQYVVALSESLETALGVFSKEGKP